ncbi:LacI family DNA-binding transcriptional regulator [Streptosporangium lutulentum]|uniref:DNA-binding LacI/PurR family transcriptional regulator n=1 Tax=Streptosporangium lutulentum TaxID=1461250 RepID=A0ABT9Q2S4_9ACTN|nr:LacI family DNA-binding transcriptional regulator [Streptosporangium lutulentum]MDP9841022.1 DNA-binding LacI/PurR family transcriptional regulator [Streptosporangium lutulentum]
MAKRPTIHDVAAAAGVSRGTVSRVLNDDRYVSPASHAAVQRAIAETGYVLNRAARSLVTQRTGSVVMVLSEPQERLFEDPNYSVLLRTATRRLAERDVSLVMMIAGNDGDRDRVVRYLRGGHADGVFLVSTHAGDTLVDALVDIPVAVVAQGSVIGRENVIPYAAADDREGARQMTRYLVELGRRRIATITGPLDTPGGVQRLEGFADILGRKASKKLIEHGDYTQLGGESAMARLLERVPDLDAVFVASDLMAAGALSALRAAGRRVPEDVAVGGFDDSTVALSTHPPLTTIRQPLERVAEETVRLLLALIDGAEHLDPVILPTTLIVREST